MPDYKVLVVDEYGVPGVMFDADDWEDAVGTIKAYAKHRGIDVTNVNGVDWTEAIDSDGILEHPAGTVYIVSSESFGAWLASQSDV